MAFLRVKWRDYDNYIKIREPSWAKWDVTIIVIVLQFGKVKINVNAKLIITHEILASLLQAHRWNNDREHGPSAL